jgi:DNA polymerase-4
LIGVSIGQLRPADTVQLTFEFDRTEATGLDAVVDGIRDRFGTAAIGRAATTGRDVVASVPLLPD